MNNSKKIIVILIVCLIVVLAGGGTAIGILLTRNNDVQNITEINDETTAGYGVLSEIGMEVGIVTDVDGAAAISESKSLEYAIPFTTKYQRDIYVTNGHEASCYIGNHEDNIYNNMYVQIYLTDENGDFAEEIYLSKIIPKGTHIESFQLERDMEPGNYLGVLVHACLTDEGVLVNNTPVVVEIHVSE